MSWQKGPLPPGTGGWGGVVPKGLKGTGFYFADFNGDHACLVHSGECVKAEDVEYYNNAIDLPPNSKPQPKPPQPGPGPAPEPGPTPIGGPGVGEGSPAEEGSAEHKGEASPNDGP